MVLRVSHKEFPGKISWLIDSKDLGKDTFIKLEQELVDTRKKGIFLNGIDPLKRDHIFDLANFAKKNNLKFGIKFSGKEEVALRKLISEELVDFLAFEISESQKFRESIGLVRASGVDYEFRIPMLKLSDPEKIKNIYEELLPCRLCVLETHSGIKIDDYKDFLKNKENVILRWS